MSTCYRYAGRARHSVSKGPLDLSPKFFRFAQNLDTRVRIPTTQNIIKSRKTQKRSTAFWYAGRDSEDCAVATKQSPGLFLPNLLLAVLAKFGASASSQVPYRSKPLLFVHKAKVICYSFHCSSAQKLPYGGASVFVKSRIKITVECQKTLNRYWYAGRARHSVLKGPLDLSPKFFRFAQNLDTRVRIPTTQNIIKSRKTQKRSTAFWYAGRDSNPRPSGS